MECCDWSCSLACRDATGKFPDYPDEEEGGSEAIFKKREELVSLLTIEPLVAVLVLRGVQCSKCVSTFFLPMHLFPPPQKADDNEVMYNTVILWPVCMCLLLFTRSLSGR